MAVSLYFGLPGCGKTTMLSKLAYKAVRSGKYKYVYSNVGINLPGVTYIDNDIIGPYNLHDCLILIDEATLFADNRGYKDFSKDRIQYFMMHRHYNADVILFTQQWDGVDKKIRVITDRVYYVFKGKILGHWISTVWKIPYGILFPDPKKSGGDKLGEIVQGYSKPPFLTRLFAGHCFRPRFYKYFDSWETAPLPSVPQKYTPVPFSYSLPGSLRAVFNKSIILLRSNRKRKKLIRKKQRKLKSIAERYVGNK